MAKKKQKKEKAGGGSSSSEMESWISSLAKEATSSEPSAVVILSKEERKRKRAAKKAKRQQQLDLKKPPPSSSSSVNNKKNQPSPQEMKRQALSSSKRRLKQLTTVLEEIRKNYQKDYRPFQVPPFKKRKTKGWNEETIQPRPSDYSGIGLARESLYMSFKDPSFFPTLEEEFSEHIPGFYGKQRTKAMKRQLDGNMLWRQLADKKVKLGKKFKGMTPDQRVEAMIESGMI